MEGTIVALRSLRVIADDQSKLKPFEKLGMKLVPSDCGNHQVKEFSLAHIMGYNLMDIIGMFDSFILEKKKDSDLVYLTLI